MKPHDFHHVNAENTVLNSQGSGHIFVGTVLPTPSIRQGNPASPHNAGKIKGVPCQFQRF
jgi:hypothetical protein